MDSPAPCRREAAVLSLPGDTDVPAAAPVAVDSTARHRDHPSLPMSPAARGGTARDKGSDERAERLARQSARLHRVRPVPRTAQWRPVECAGPSGTRTAGRAGPAARVAAGAAVATVATVRARPSGDARKVSWPVSSAASARW
nr:phosphotransferase [Streptomyces albaduncus]